MFVRVLKSDLCHTVQPLLSVDYLAWEAFVAESELADRECWERIEEWRQQSDRQLRMATFEGRFAEAGIQAEELVRILELRAQRDAEAFGTAIFKSGSWATQGGQIWFRLHLRMSLRYLEKIWRRELARADFPRPVQKVISMEDWNLINECSSRQDFAGVQTRLTTALRKAGFVEMKFPTEDILHRCSVFLTGASECPDNLVDWLSWVIQTVREKSIDRDRMAHATRITPRHLRRILSGGVPKLPVDTRNRINAFLRHMHELPPKLLDHYQRDVQQRDQNWLLEMPAALRAEHRTRVR